MGLDVSSNNFLFCPLHNQETLKLFCETCDVLLCRHCLLLDHKDHRFRRLDEALQNQRTLLENVVSQVEEKKIVVQAAGKQVEDRLYEIKHMHRKVENQIKMTKMVIINELSKRMNLLLEQLEKITSERQHKFEQQLQSILVLNRQLEHVQNFINWAMYGKNSLPFLFSKELIVFQMQRLLEANCGSDLGRPQKMKFSWEPSYWTKQIANLGCIITENGNLAQPETPGYVNNEDVQSSYYQSQHPSNIPHTGSVTNSQSYASTVQCPTPICCNHCHTVPPPSKVQPANSSVNHPLSYMHPPGIKQQHVSPIQYNATKEQRCVSRPLKLVQPWLTHQPPTEHENSPYWLENQHQRQQIPPPLQNAPSICSVTAQEFNQVHNVHAIPMSTQTPVQAPSVQAPSVQMQLGPVHNLNHLQQQRHQSTQQTPVCQAESAQEQVMHHSLDLINQQFELEQMQKGLELLLQSQPSNVQLNQNKQPQHVQQTIVGQINYIVRQPANVPLQSQDDVQPVCDEPISPGGQTVDLSPVTTNSPVNLQSQSIADEIIAAVESDARNMNSFPEHTVRKRSASESFPNSSDMDLSSPRLSRSVDPQMQAVSCQYFAQSQDMSYTSDVESERLTSYSSDETGVTDNLHIGPADHLATGPALLGNAICKIENEDFSCNNGAKHIEVENESSNTINDIVLPLDNIFEEPINLSVKKPVVSEPKRILTHTQPSPIKQLKNEDSNNCFQQRVTEDNKNNENSNRLETKETKIPYVRLERLKICTPGTGELPVFKVQPSKKDDEGSLRLLIKYGTQSKSMSIKVNPDTSNPSMPSTDISPQPTLPYGPEGIAHISAPSFPQLPHHMKTVSGANSCIARNQSKPSAETLSSQKSDPDRTANVLPLVMKKFGNSDDRNQIENEDFCAVCLNGGEMLCCDQCPKVFHLSCHVPALLSFPVGEWVCTLCRSLTKPEVEYDCDNIRYSRECRLEEVVALPNLSDLDQRKCEKLVLSLCCNSLSLPFQEPVSPLARHYYQIIKRPMDLSIIQRKLQKRNVPHYSSPEELVFDVRLMFWNCAKFNYLIKINRGTSNLKQQTPPFGTCTTDGAQTTPTWYMEDSEVAEAGRNLELFFDKMVKEAYPDKIFLYPQEEDSDTDEIGNENCSMSLKGFHWPSYGQECVQPKRRRRHTVNQKTKDFSLC
ncbi:tripartite motif-containing protein 66 [Bombina bombina]|uniref:tripartite motif-containing protein 66 n=1 Tax=Bombina bombina TaxID=8345 RepID=UPI00235AA3F8|nr:tripartite motif-containing protein 66 [Bombina bombina]